MSTQTRRKKSRQDTPIMFPGAPVLEMATRQTLARRLRYFATYLTACADVVDKRDEATQFEYMLHQLPKVKEAYRDLYRMVKTIHVQSKKGRIRL